MRLRVLLAALLLAGCGASRIPVPTARDDAPTAPRSTPRSDPLAVLHVWDEARAAAWAQGDTTRLLELYVPGSAAGRRDVAALRRWTARGFTVHGVRMQVLRVRVEVVRPEALRLDVVDRLARAEARGGGVVRRLPATTPQRRTVELRLAEGRWKVLAVRPWRPAGRR